MKKKIIMFVFVTMLMSLVYSASGCVKTVNTDYLRIHIRANSDRARDQEIKLAVRDSVIEYLSPFLEEAKSEAEAEKIVVKHIAEMGEAIDELLFSCGYAYGCKIEIGSEHFDERTYGDLTLPEGKYRAVIVNLGTGEGHNWWCVAFPPLCFTLGEDYKNVNYKSILYEVVKKYLKKEGK